MVRLSLQQQPLLKRPGIRDEEPLQEIAPVQGSHLVKTADTFGAVARMPGLMLMHLAGREELGEHCDVAPGIACRIELHGLAGDE